VESRTGAKPSAPWIKRLAPTNIALLDCIADGQTVSAAAKNCFMSLRTANRRLREVRALIGVTTTRELVAAYRRDGPIH
jgi:DNA-binding NarL/FixJ family response regulator